MVRHRIVFVVAAILLFGSLIPLAYAVEERLKPVEKEAREWLGMMKFAETLHATTKGMKYWYECCGMGKYVGVPYEALFCKKCHATCESCHAVKDANGNVVDFSLSVAKDRNTCLKCHGRQAKAIALGQKNPEWADVHLIGLGVNCVYCHSSKEVHGMHGEFNYMFEGKGIFEVSCEKCHIEKHIGPPVIKTIPEHKQHLDDISCSACHSPTTVTCYNCHLSYAYETYKLRGKPAKKAIPIAGWLFLVKDKRTGKIVPGNIMVLVWTGKDVEAVRVDIAQMFPHIVTTKARHCEDCHATANVKELLEKRELRLVWIENGEVKHLTGIIPIVEGTKLVLQTFAWNPEAGKFKPYKVVTVDVEDTLIENTAALTWEELEKLAKPQPST